MIWAAAGFVIGQPKGYPIAGPVLGFLLGPIGLFILRMSSEKVMPCPFCCQKIKKTAQVCKYCGQSPAMRVT
jgi:hypothetical protein